MDVVSAGLCSQGKVRVRIAPSPTGRLHIGNLRAALFNWLFARHTKGTFVIRIEDTDLERSKPEYVDSILDAFSWVGMKSDESILYQSQRTTLYQDRINQLLESGDAYWSDPLSEENGISVVRFRVPRDNPAVTFNDMIRGPITVPTDQIDDFVIARSDGSPLYNFVVVVDDVDMQMTHIIRGEDHISNTPKQVLLYRALGAALPQFAHLPLILGSSGAPLSKRDAATAVLDYKDQGFLPQALCNYLVRLGWSHGDQEIFSQDEMIALFDVADVQKAGAVFDLVKLRWMNGVYMRLLSAQELVAYLKDVMGVDLVAACSDWTQDQIFDACALYKERVSTLRELEVAVVSLYQGPRELAPLPEVFDARLSRFLESFLWEFNLLDEVTRSSVEALIRKICSDEQVGLVALAKPLRFALTGSLESPSVFSLVELLGRDTVVDRVMALQGAL